MHFYIKYHRQKNKRFCLQLVTTLLPAKYKSMQINGSFLSLSEKIMLFYRLQLLGRSQKVEYFCSFSFYIREQRENRNKNFINSYFIRLQFSLRKLILNLSYSSYVKNGKLPKMHFSIRSVKVEKEKRFLLYYQITSCKINLCKVKNILMVCFYQTNNFKFEISLS